MPVVVNCTKTNYDVYIGRGTKWGNPFVLCKDGDRKEVIDKYEQYLIGLISDKIITTQDLLSLEGKRLGCHCYPKPCHGNVIAKYVNRAVMFEKLSSSIFSR